MTNDNNSLLAHLTWRFTNRTEEVATESLCYILSQWPEARAALVEALRAAEVDIGTTVRVQTEVIGEKNERVDLVIYDDANIERVLIESKFWASLTENQPNTYLGRLPNDGMPTVLLFVSPEKRLETLWPELKRLAEKEFAIGPLVGSESIVSATVNGSGRHLALTSWRNLLGRMAEAVGNDSAREDIRQLQRLCERMDTDAFLPLRADEIGPDFSRRAIDLHRIFTNSVQRARDQGIAILKGLGVSNPLPNYGRYMYLADAIVWFGINFELGVRYRETPMWLMFGLDEAHSVKKIDVVRRGLKSLLTKTPPEVIEGEKGQIYAPIYLPKGAEHDAVISAVLQRLREIADLMN